MCLPQEGRERVAAKKSPNKKLIGGAILAVLIPLLAASEKSMKSLIDDWFETCSVVVEVGDFETKGNGNYFPVNLYVQGDSPNEAALVVSADKEIFTKLEYIHDLDSNNRNLHPAAPTTPQNKPSLNITVDLTPFKSRLLYSFRAYVSNDKIHDVKTKKVLTGAFVQFPPGVSADLCRVEKDTFFNMLVGSGPGARFGFLILLIVTLTGAVTLLRR